MGAHFANLRTRVRHAVFPADDALFSGGQNDEPAVARFCFTPRTPAAVLVVVVGDGWHVVMVLKVIGEKALELRTKGA